MFLIQNIIKNLKFRHKILDWNSDNMTEYLQTLE